MKKLFTILLTVLSIQGLMSQTLSVSTNNINIGANHNSTASFTITSDTYWGIYNLPQWLTVDTIWGNGNIVMNLKAEENSFTKLRKTEIVVYCVNSNWQYHSDIKITITQGASTQGISDTTIQIGANIGSQASFSVNSNTYWEVTDKPSWIMLNRQNSTATASITATATKNPLIVQREGYVTIKRIGSSGENIYGTVKIIQSPSDIGISAERINLSNTEGSFEQLLINNNTGWSISGQASWITTTPSEGSNNGFTRIIATQNNDIFYRLDTIRIACTNGTNYDIIIVQDPAPATITINPSILHFPENETIINVEVTANTNWGIINFPDWIETSNIYRWGTSSFELNATDWVENREATVLVYWFDENEIYHQRNVRIIQTSRTNVDISEIQLSNDYILFPNPATNKISVQSQNNTDISKLEILNMEGKKLGEWYRSNNNIDISNFDNGNYLIKIKDSNGQSSRILRIVR